jgi:YVTN family beta-propeller protein
MLRKETKMIQRFECSTGLSWWLRLTLCAAGALGCALCSVTPAGAYCVYVANSESDSVSVIDTATNSVSATIGNAAVLFNHPSGPALTPDTRFLYVANRGSLDRVPGSTVSVIATAANTLAATVELAPGSGPYSVAITPDGAVAYVANQFADTVSVIDTAKALADPSTAVIKTIPVGPYPVGVAISPDGGFAYVSSCGAPCDGSALSVTVVDTTDNEVRTTVPGLFIRAITPDGQFAYSPNGFADTVQVIDTAKVLTEPTHAVIKTISVANFPYAAAMTPSGRFAYVTQCGEFCLSDEPSSASSVSVIDTGTNTVAATVSLPPTSGPTSIAIAPDGTFAHVTNGWSQTVAVIDTAKAVTDPTHAVNATIQGVGERPEGIAIAPLPMCVDGHPTCVGDCGVDRRITVDELLAMVNIALGNAEISGCNAGDRDGSGQITIDEILTAVNNALNGC